MIAGMKSTPATKPTTRYAKGAFVKSFEKYLDTTDGFSLAEKNDIHHSLQDKRIRKITKLSFILIVWSVFGIFMDKVIVGGSIIAALMKESIDYTIVLPFLIFMMFNIIIKYLFIRYYNHKHTLSLTPATQIQGTVPYFGLLLVFGNTLQNGEIFIKALRKFVSYKRKKIWRKYRGI